MSYLHFILLSFYFFHLNFHFTLEFLNYSISVKMWSQRSHCIHSDKLWLIYIDYIIRNLAKFLCKSTWISTEIAVHWERYNYIKNLFIIFRSSFQSGAVLLSSLSTLAQIVRDDIYQDSYKTWKSLNLKTKIQGLESPWIYKEVLEILKFFML
jgi:hypothetical protein